jgi:hypothetical protein
MQYTQHISYIPSSPLGEEFSSPAPPEPRKLTDAEFDIYKNMACIKKYVKQTAEARAKLQSAYLNVKERHTALGVSQAQHKPPPDCLKRATAFLKNAPEGRRGLLALEMGNDRLLQLEQKGLQLDDQNTMLKSTGETMLHQAMMNQGLSNETVSNLLSYAVHMHHAEYTARVIDYRMKQTIDQNRKALKRASFELKKAENEALAGSMATVERCLAKLNIKRGRSPIPQARGRSRTPPRSILRHDSPQRRRQGSRSPSRHNRASNRGASRSRQRPKNARRPSRTRNRSPSPQRGRQTSNSGQTRQRQSTRRSGSQQNRRRVHFH